MFEGERFLILGAGGAARAVAMMLAEKSVKEIRILNRSFSKAADVAGEINGYLGRELVLPMELSAWRELPAGEQFTVIQATNVGMYPKVEEAVIEEPGFYEKVKIGYDLIYNPMETKFMKLVRQSGGKAFHGFKMLLYQGILAFELWTGEKISEELAGETYAHLLQEMKK